MQSTVLNRLNTRELQVPEQEAPLIHQRIKIGVILGASGAGKTSVIAEVRKRIANSRIMRSVTTREERPGIDQPGEYEFVREAKFRRMAARDKFLWFIRPEKGHKNWYGTLRIDVDDALKASDPTMMHMTPEYMFRLHEYAEQSTKFIFLVVKDEELLERRLRSRDPGLGNEYYRDRIKECRSWYGDAKATNLCSFIDNGDDFENTMDQVMHHLAHPDMFTQR